MSSLFSVQTRLLSANSQNYLRGIYSLPLGVLPEKITFKSLAVRGKHAQEIKAILNRLAHKENNFKNQCQKTLARVEAHLKKLTKWMLGVSLIAVLLLVTLILCALFFPPAIALIQPLSIALGKGFYWLLLLTGLPSLGLGIAHLFDLHQIKKLQYTLTRSNTIINQVEQALQSIESISHASSPIDLINPVHQTLFAVPRRNSDIFTVDNPQQETANKNIDERSSITYRNSL